MSTAQTLYAQAFVFDVLVSCPYIKSLELATIEQSMIFVTKQLLILFFVPLLHTVVCTLPVFFLFVIYLIVFTCLLRSNTKHRIIDFFGCSLNKLCEVSDCWICVI